ncbi:hypothetical protein [Arthrobacter methylotrophus]
MRHGAGPVGGRDRADVDAFDTKKRVCEGPHILAKKAVSFSSP